MNYPETIRANLKQLRDDTDAIDTTRVADPRALALVKTKLDEAEMWFKRALEGREP